MGSADPEISSRAFKGEGTPGQQFRDSPLKLWCQQTAVLIPRPPRAWERSQLCNHSRRSPELSRGGLRTG
jgi:hypothetical protein